LPPQDWPGSIRELENAIEYAFILCRSGFIGFEHPPHHLRVHLSPLADAVGLTLRDIEKQAVPGEALERNLWRRIATARELGIDKNTLRRKIKRLGINAPPRRNCFR